MLVYGEGRGFGWVRRTLGDHHFVPVRKKNTPRSADPLFLIVTREVYSLGITKTGGAHEQTLRGLDWIDWLSLSRLCYLPVWLSDLVSLFGFGIVLS
jgi:hypothetical protein